MTPAEGDPPDRLLELDIGELGRRYSNWGRWGPDDELGTLNFITAEIVRDAATLVRRGVTFSLAVPYDENGPQSGRGARFNPIHLMSRDGADVAAGTFVRDFRGGVDTQSRGLDDIVIMPLQCGTQWDALSHIVHDDRLYNGYPASSVTSRGAMRNDIAAASGSLIGRGVLVDIARWKQKPWLDPGEVITGDDLEACVTSQAVDVRSGDVLFLRTGRIARMRAEGTWGDYDDVTAPCAGLGVESLDWIHTRQIAAVAADNLGVEVLPSQVAGVFVPLHTVLIVYMGMPLGEIFDLEALAADCAEDRVYEFLFVGPPLPFTRAVGSPVNPIALK